MLLELILPTYVTAFGLVVGSYLNVVIHRLPRGFSTVLPVSRCPTCQSRIRARDNVPVLSWLLLRGRCRDCAAPISWRYPLVEATTGLLFLASYLRFGASWEAAVAALFASAMVTLAMIDAEHFILPDRITLPGIAIGLLLQTVVDWTSLRSALLGAAAGAGVILAMNGLWWLVRRVQGFGLGDVKMLAMIGAFLGFPGMVLTLFLGTLVGSLTGLALVARGSIEMRSKLPFGFFLALGSIATVYLGPALVGWYVSFLP
ncbi:MAG: prepilin peptidase [Thermoanaerobaculia bacterium]|nr:prepilin peptidase [Thermoanaerobaculia bacterium]